MKIEDFVQQFQQQPSLAKAGTGEENSAGIHFADELKEKIEEVDQMQHRADNTIEDRSVNGATKIHEAMIDLADAEISLKLLLKVRNKAVEAYQEISKMNF